MRKKNREINILSMSVLDLFCSAMGAFMIIAIIVMPSYSKRGDFDVAQKQVKDLKTQLSAERGKVKKLESQAEDSQKKIKNLQSQLTDSNKAQSRIAELETQVSKSKQKVSELQAKLDRTFMIVVASWGTADDIDTYLEVPTGQVFSYKNRVYSGVKGSLAEDSRNAGTEIWETSNASPGTYRLFYVAYEKRYQGTTTVKVRIYSKDGKIDLPDAMVGSNNYSATYIITVDDKGDIHVRTENIRINFESGGGSGAGK